MVPVVWRPGCLFTLLCNKMDSLKYNKYAIQPYNFISFSVFVPVFTLEVLALLTEKLSVLETKDRGGGERLPFWQLI